VTRYDFIFSKQLRPRILRHASFWLAYWFFFLISAYIPVCVFPGWDTSQFSTHVARIGLSRWFELRFINSSGIFLPLVFFTYTVIYFALPRFLSRKTNNAITVILFLLILVPILVAEYFGWYMSAYNNFRAAPGRTMPDHLSTLSLTAKFVATNYPVVAGLALIIKLLKRWYLKQQETMQVAKEKATAELQLLKARIHPHFLFNSLNNIYSFAIESSPKTPEMIQKLSHLLHYMLFECSQEQVELSKEIQMIEDYIELEKIRYGKRLTMHMQIQHNGNNQLVAPLLFIPFIENCFKHGSGKMLANTEIKLNISVEKDILIFKLVNSKPVLTNDIHENGSHGLGLKNVKKRLELLYADRHDLQIISEPETFTVCLKMVLKESAGSRVSLSPQKEKIVYELA